ncbi:MAG: PHP domain-containing protein [Nitrospinae bacterium]|nr:PHP domain-containing protein [Nitrospinota bacterium]
MYKIDFHIHTRNYSACSSVEPEAVVKEAESLGIDVLIFTEHDVMWKKEELEAINFISPKVTVLNGIEVSTRQGHMLLFGVEEGYEADRYQSIEQFFYSLRGKKELLVIPAHPYRFSSAHGEMLRGYDFDALECYSLNSNLSATAQAIELARIKKVPALATSDLHDIEKFGKYWSETKVNIKSMKDFIKAVKKGKVFTPDVIVEKLTPYIL